MNQRRPTLLIVDDEPEVLRSLHDLFRLEYRVITHERGVEALRALEREPEIHVILSDQRMPEMTGVEFLGLARGLRPDATRLLLTGYADIKAVVDAINRGGVYRYITKPWDPDELESTVRQAVEQHELIVEKNRLLAELKQSNTRLEETNRLKSAFIEVASHELNTPVAIVLGMTELWKMSQAPTATPAERGWVDRIQAAAKRLANTVERMFKLLRADQLDHTLDIRRIEIEALVLKVLADLRPFLLARQQSVDVKIDRQIDTIDADPSKLSDILTNLIVNAIKFTPDGGTIRLAVDLLSEDLARFEISDQGIGIKPTDREHLFEPFFTGYDTLNHSSGDFQFCKRGIGLGLCLVKTFVELHGGHVEVISKPDGGSIFRFVLPILARVREAC